MTAVIQLRAQVLFFMVAALAAVTLMAQYVSSLLVQGLNEGASLRIAPLTECSVSGDGAHFTGCSSIL